MNFCKNQLLSTKTARRDALQLELPYKITVGKTLEKEELFLAILKCCVYNGRDSERKQFV